MADENQVDYMAECALRNESVEETRALMQEKEDWEMEKNALIMDRERLRNEVEEVEMRLRFAESLCEAMHLNERNVVQEKKRIWMLVICLMGCLVAFIFGVVMKLK